MAHKRKQTKRWHITGSPADKTLPNNLTKILKRKLKKYKEDSTKTTLIKPTN